MDRREFIGKCGSGLAGIIIASEAPAVIVRSQIGVNGTKNTDNVSPLTNPYVTEGLMLMYDGIWNTGLGKHDGNAKAWKDLSNNGYDLDIRDACYFTDKSLFASPNRTVKDAAGTTTPFYPSADAITIEIGYNATGGNNPGTSGEYEFFYAGTYSSYGISLSKSGYSGMRVMHKQRNKTIDCYTGGTSIQVDGERFVQIVASYTDGATIEFAEICKGDGNWQTMGLKSTGTTTNIPTGIHIFGGSNSNGTPSKIGWGSVFGYVYYCRVYGRVLSHEELIANRALDEERFGI